MRSNCTYHAHGRMSVAGVLAFVSRAPVGEETGLDEVLAGTRLTISLCITIINYTPPGNRVQICIEPRGCIILHPPCP